MSAILSGKEEGKSNPELADSRKRGGRKRRRKRWMNSFLGVSDHRHSTESCKNPVRRRRSLNHEVRWRGLGSRSANANAIWPKFIPRRENGAENCVTSKTLTPPPASLLGKKDCVLLDPSSEVLANNEATPLSFWHFRTIATREQGLTFMLGKANEEPLLAAHDARSLARSLTPTLHLTPTRIMRLLGNRD